MQCAIKIKANGEKYDWDKGQELVKLMMDVEHCHYVKRKMEEMTILSMFGKPELELIVTILLLENIQRPGAVLNMTVDELKSAECTIVRGKKIHTVAVSDHKTVGLHGSAEIHFRN